MIGGGNTEVPVTLVTLGVCHLLYPAVLLKIIELKTVSSLSQTVT